MPLAEMTPTSPPSTSAQGPPFEPRFTEALVTMRPPPSRGRAATVPRETEGLPSLDRSKAFPQSRAQEPTFRALESPGLRQRKEAPDSPDATAIRTREESVPSSRRTTEAL